MATTGRGRRSLTRWGAAVSLSAGLGLGPALASTGGTTCIETRRTKAGLLIAPVNVEKVGQVSTGGAARTYWFVVDTGSGVTIVDDEVVKALELPPSARTTVVTTGGALDVLLSRLSLTFGAVRADDLEVVRNPLKELHAIDPDIHGVLGQDVLRQTNWLLDYERGVVIQDPLRGLAPGADAHRVPVRWVGERPIVDVSFGRSASVRLVLDSAATGIVLYRMVAGWTAPSRSHDKFSHIRALGVERDVPLLTADTLRVGSATLAHPVAAILPQDSDVDEADGVLPASLFDSLYFDQRDSTALLSAPSAASGGRRIIRPRCEAAASFSS